MTTIQYRVVEAPPIDRLVDSWKYVYMKGDVTVSFSVERDHTQAGNEHLVKFEMGDCLVLGVEYETAWPLTVRVKLFSPTRATGSQIQHNATAMIEYPRRKGTLEFHAN